MINIKLRPLTGAFAENKDVAQMIRIEMIAPALARGEILALDFSGIEGATQSFIHALISELFREHGGMVLDRLQFKNCNQFIRQVITIVTEYMQEAE